jgi:ADP-heptose:LPS heptosyltransferase
LHRTGTIHDFDGTMAVLDAFDLLVSVDTGVVHLARAQ